MIIIQPLTHGKPAQQWRGEQAAPRGRANQGEARQIQPHAARVRPLIDDNVELEIFHCRVEILLDGFLKPMNFVDEQHVALFEVSQQAREVARFFDRRSARAFTFAPIALAMIFASVVLPSPGGPLRRI